MLIIAAIPIFILGWMGFVPGLSTLMGSTGQKNLGVRITSQNLANMQYETPLTFKSYSQAPANLQRTGTQQIFTQPAYVQHVTLSQADATALLDAYPWSWMPLDNAQVRFAAGTVEISGLLNTARMQALAQQYVAHSKGHNSTFSELIGWISNLRNHAPIYLKAQASVVNGSLKFKLEQVQVGRLTIPNGLIQSSTNQGATIHASAGDLHAQTIYFTDQTLHFTGTYPSVIYVKH